MSPLKIFVYLFSGLALIGLGILFWPSSTVQEQPPAVIAEQIVNIPEVDRVREFFNLSPPKLPIVETVTYTSHAPWLKGKPAWLADYANYYKTSRHFIARSLNQKPDYLKQNVREGDRFNVLKPDLDISFHLLLDLSKLKLLFYYIDSATQKPELIKTYTVSVGREDKESTSGYLTPLGVYSLGDKVAIYDSKKIGFYQGEKMPMVKIFGTRWIPFEKEIENCTGPAKGLGIHGTPWVEDPFTQDLREDSSLIGCHSSDGCIRLRTEDVEELFAIIISRPTTIEIVKDYQLATIAKRGG
jgi:hypothetical protein